MLLDDCYCGKLAGDFWWVSGCRSFFPNSSRNSCSSMSKGEADLELRAGGELCELKLFKLSYLKHVEGLLPMLT